MRRILLWAAAGAVVLAVAAWAVGGAAAGSAPALTHLGVVQKGHQVQPVQMADPHFNGVLYDQNNNDSGVGVSSQNFESAFDAFDSQAADDFVVPAKHPWNITSISVTGVFATPPSENVTFYEDANGLPGDVESTQTAVGTGSGGSLTIPLTDVTLGPGTHWVSVQANLDLNTGGQWFWEGRSVQNGNPAVWQNPGNGFGTGCTTWATMTGCTGVGPDLMFSLSGRQLGKP